MKKAQIFAAQFSRLGSGRTSQQKIFGCIPPGIIPSPSELRASTCSFQTKLKQNEYKVIWYELKKEGAIFRRINACTWASLRESTNRGRERPNSFGVPRVLLNLSAGNGCFKYSSSWMINQKHSLPYHGHAKANITHKTSPIEGHTNIFVYRRPPYFWFPTLLSRSHQSYSAVLTNKEISLSPCR